MTLQRSRRATTKCRARCAVVWGLTGCLLALVLGIVLDGADPALHDSSYATRLQLLRERRRERPDVPVFMVMGSSRTSMAFAPELLAETHPTIIFNFSHFGAGPVMNLMTLNRLLADGVRPDQLIVELVPSYLAFEGPRFLMGGVGGRDLPVVAGSFPLWTVVPLYLEQRARRAFKVYAGWGVPPAAVADCGPLGGFLTLTDDMSDGEKQVRTEQAADRMGRRLHDFHILPNADRATRELITLCRGQHIPLTLLLTPEGSTFRSWYDVAAWATVEQYLDSLRRDEGVPVVDGRHWLADADFYDSHHVLRRGAAAFTARLEQELFRPWSNGSPTGERLPTVSAQPCKAILPRKKPLSGLTG